eukprot:scaffold291901_cov36-Tisochrysis_lutea.AAC.1
MRHKKCDKFKSLDVGSVHKGAVVERGSECISGDPSAPSHQTSHGNERLGRRESGATRESGAMRRAKHWTPLGTSWHSLEAGSAAERLDSLWWVVQGYSSLHPRLWRRR